MSENKGIGFYFGHVWRCFLTYSCLVKFLFYLFLYISFVCELRPKSLLKLTNAWAFCSCCKSLIVFI